jgi:Protein of unknown function (DUF3710)
MSPFRRRKSGSTDPDDADTAAGSARGGDDADERVDGDFDDDFDDLSAEPDAAEDDEADGSTGAARRPTATDAGPWDVSSAPDDRLPRLDLGSLRVPVVEGIEIQINLDEASGTVAAVTLVTGDSALQVQAFAAPRNEGIWDEVRQELAAEITRDGGLADPVRGENTSELVAQIPVAQPNGSRQLAPVRFLGADGPRWMLRGVLSGAAAGDAASAAALLEVFAGTIVDRGTEAFAPRDLLPLRLPDQSADSGGGGPQQDPADRQPLDLGGSGQWITEIR